MTIARIIRTRTPSAGGGGGGSALFSDTFAGGSFASAQNGFNWGGDNSNDNGSTAIVQTNDPNAGDYALRFRYNANIVDASAERRIYFGQEMTDFWMRYDLLIPSNYAHRVHPSGGGNNNKFGLAIWGGGDDNYNDPTTPGIDINFWSGGGANISFGDVYYFTSPSPYPDFDESAFEPLDAQGDAITSADLGQWLTLTFHAWTAAGPGQFGGLRVYRRRAFTGSHLLWCDSSAQNTGDGSNYLTGQTGFDVLYLMGWSNTGYVQQTDFFMRNVQIAASDIWGDLS
jgi:hypothetical protein